MKRTILKKVISTKILFLTMFWNYGQSNKLKINVDESDKTHIKAYLSGQFWARYMDMNPGTTLNGDTINNKFDFSIRRLRLDISAQLTPKLFLYALFGNNNINFNTEKTFIINMLNFNVEYEFAPQFALDVDEHAWHGLSRWTTQSNSKLMTLDAPIFSLFTVDKNDDLWRNLGARAKGQIGKIDHNFSVDNPTNYRVAAKKGKTDYALNNPSMRWGGYAKYKFWDNESNKTAYSGATRTYLGKKNILNLGAGFIYQPKMTSRLVNGIEKFYDYKNLAANFFLDKILNKEKASAITSYLGYFDTDFGHDYIRNVDANDYTSGGTSFNGSGNDFPMMGTGSTLFLQLDYLTGKNKKDIQFQPNAAIQYSNFDALDDSMIVYDFGMNVIIKGHANKLSANYQLRPIYQTGDTQTKIDDWKDPFVLQYNITIN